jgi:hypothetical protein
MIEWKVTLVGVAKAADAAGLPRSTVRARLCRGWSPVDALAQPKLPSGAFRHLLTPDERRTYDSIKRYTQRGDPIKARHDTLKAIGRSDLVKS